MYIPGMYVPFSGISKFPFPGSVPQWNDTTCNKFDSTLKSPNRIDLNNEEGRLSNASVFRPNTTLNKRVL